MVIVDLKKVICSSSSCPGRRAHHEEPDVPRGPQEMWVPASHPGPYYCSVECMHYGRVEGKREEVEAQAAPSASPEAIPEAQGQEETLGEAFERLVAEREAK